jgi:ABC-type glycerol-3-phosphate transport system permease component
MMPGVLLLIPLYILLRQFNLINTHWALILSYSTFTIPFCFLLAKSYFNGLPDELFEAAFVDGCTSWQAFIKVGIPMAAPGLMVTSVYAFLLAWNDFMFANTFVNSDHLRTLPSGIVNMQTSWGVQWGQMTAASTVTVLPVFLVFMIANKYIIEGLTAGAVKG